MNRVAIVGVLAAFILILVIVADADLRKQKIPGRRAGLWGCSSILIVLAGLAILLIPDPFGEMELQVRRVERHELSLDSLAASVARFVAKDPNQRQQWMVRKLIDASIPGSEPLIVAVFRGYAGHNKEVAEDLLNSGNVQLADSALAWAREWGLAVEKRSGNAHAKWRGSPAR
jgi:hypothetical protein